MPIEQLSRTSLGAATDLLAGSVAVRARSASLASDPLDDEVHQRCRAALATYVESPDRFAYLATDGRGRAEALVSAVLTRLTPQDEAFTYAAPVSVLLPLSGWCVRDAAAAVRWLPEVYAKVVQVAADQGVRRVDVQSLEGDWVAGAVWRSLGLRPFLSFAARPLGGRDRPVRARNARATRLAGTADLPRMGELLLEEIRHHADHTIGGVSAEQDPSTISRIVGGSLDHDAAEHRARSFVYDEGGAVLGLSSVHVMTTPEQSTARHYLPVRYAYLALLSVTARARGRGIGAVLALRALEWARSVPEPPEVIALHYATDNTLSAPFWASHGYAGVVVTLTNAGDRSSG